MKDVQYKTQITIRQLGKSYQPNFLLSVLFRSTAQPKHEDRNEDNEARLSEPCKRVRYDHGDDKVLDSSGFIYDSTSIQ